MIIQNEKYTVTIKVDEAYTVESADNQHYDIELNPHHYRHNDLCKTFCIRVEKGEEVTQIALVGDFYSYDTDCAILENDILSVLQNNTITQIDMRNCDFLKQMKFECFGCNFGIYKVSKGYIIYGEMEITMLDNDFCKKWSFSGRDIFVSHSNKKAFEICENAIKLYDWEDNYYEIDFNGNLIH